MRLDAAFGAAHRLRSLCHIEFLPDAQEKRLLLPQRKGTQGHLEFGAGALALAALATAAISTHRRKDTGS